MEGPHVTLPRHRVTIALVPDAQKVTTIMATVKAGMSEAMLTSILADNSRQFLAFSPKA